MPPEAEYRVLFTIFGRQVRVNEAVTRATRNIRTTRLTFGSHGALGEWFKAEEPGYKARRRSGGPAQSTNPDSFPGE